MACIIHYDSAASRAAVLTQKPVPGLAPLDDTYVKNGASKEDAEAIAMMVPVSGITFFALPAGKVMAAAAAAAGAAMLNR
jgi:hypothetical protein